MRRSETGGFSLAVFAPIIAAALGGLAALALAAQLVNLAPTSNETGSGVSNTTSQTSGDLSGADVQYGGR